MMSTHTMTFDTRRAKANIRQIMALLKERPMTMNELAEEMAVQRVTAWLYVTHLREKPGRIRIVTYELIGKRYTPVFRAEKGRDAIKITRRQQERLSKELPLRPRILALLERSPGCTIREIAERFDAAYGAVWNVVDRLHKKKEIQIAGRADTGEYQWGLPRNPAPAQASNQLPAWAAALGA